MEYIEFKGTTKNDAITAACTHFSIPSDKLDYEIIEEGKAGFLGIGSRSAIIKARVKEEFDESALKEPVIATIKSTTASVKPAVANIKPVTSNVRPSVANAKNVTEKIDDADISAISGKFLKDVFKAMDLNVDVDVKYNEALRNLDVELSGDEMGVLIGKRGQTLDSLQYLISLVVNKGTGEYVRVKVDTENYRERRKETLENLAKNISFKVKRTRRSVSLEPMNPYERRIIHSALQNDRYVTTHSEGEEPFRRVVVVPKKENSYSERGGNNYNGYSRGGYSKGGYNRSGNNRESYGNSRGGYSRGYNRDYKNDSRVSEV